MAPPQKITDPDIIAKLMDLRIIDQVPWKELPAHYKEMTDGEDINYQTIKSALRRAAPVDFLPTRVSNGIRELIEEKRAEIYDVFSLTLAAVNVRFAEFMTLVGKQRLAEIDAAVPDEEKDGSEVEFKKEDLERMDLMYNDLLAFSFRFAGILREMGGAGQYDVAKGMGLKASTTVEEVAKETVTIETTIKRMMAKVTVATKQQLQEIAGTHRGELRGNYRILPSQGEDLEGGA